jgi:thiamine-phosphate pyrophosphorylase
MKPLAECFFYTFVDSAYLHGRDPAKICRQLCEGGSDLIQLRAKDWPIDRVETTACHLREITRERNVGLVINDYPEIARRVGADLCHLGQEDFFDRGHTHTSSFGNLSIGLSTHAPDQAMRALRAEPGYIAIGPVFATGTKPTAKAVTLEYVTWAAANVSVPWFAIGGINAQNLPDILNAGARRVCVVSAVLNSRDIEKTCRDLRALLG